MIHAAGAVVWRTGPEGPEVLVVHRPKYDDWSLPKGKQEPGEHLLVTAVREVEEETSVRPVLGPPLPSASYLYRGQDKRVDYWAATTYDDAKPSNEVDEVAWLPLNKAAEYLSYPHDQDVVAGLTPIRTIPLILLRHASAVPKDGGNPPGRAAGDLLRPLDRHGKRDADALAGLLACFAPRARVLSSPALRCAQTVQPYAARAEVRIEKIQDFIITTSAPRPTDLIRGLLAARRPVIVCLHRENLPEMLATACDLLGADPPPDPALPKGAFWVLHTRPGELAAIERHVPGGSLNPRRHFMYQVGEPGEHVGVGFR
jgi:8-oxo-dGTP diphosphatase